METKNRSLSLEVAKGENKLGIVKFWKKREKTPHEKPEKFCLDANKMIDKMKAALQELWVLSCLNCRNMTVWEILDLLQEKSGDVLNITYPAGAVYVLTQGDYIQEVPSTTKRTYLRITEKGIQYLSELRQNYEWFIQTNDAMLRSVAKENL